MTSELVSKSNRIIWIDWAKTIGIFLVIVGHAVPINSIIWNFLYSFHMPLFFIISGYLYKNNDNLNKILRNLLIPYICFCLINLIFWMATNWNSFNSHDVYMRIIGIFLAVGYKTEFSIMPCVPAWFFIALLWIRVLFLFINTKNKIIFICSIFFPAITYLLHKNGVDLYFSIDSALMAFPFFVLGLSLKNKLKSPIGLRKLNLFIIALFIGILVLYLSYINGRGSINACYFGENILLYYFTAVLGSSMIILFSMIPGYSKIVNNISVGTPFIIGTHLLLLGRIVYHFNKWGGFDQFNLGITIISALLVLVISYYPILISEKYFPFLIGKGNVYLKNK